MKGFITSIYSVNEFFLLIGSECAIEKFKLFREKVHDFGVNSIYKINVKEELMLKAKSGEILYKLYTLVICFNNNVHIQKWGRAIILNINSDSLATVSLKVFFVDYGNVEDINVTETRIFIGKEIPQEIYLYLLSLIPCSLYKNDNKVHNKDVNQKFCDIVRLHNGNLDVKIEMHSTGIYYLVSLFIPNICEKTSNYDENPDTFSLAHMLMPSIKEKSKDDPNLVQFKRELTINTFQGIQRPIIIT